MHRVVLVTGASSGIGRETAQALAREGESLVLVARRVAELEQVAEECRVCGSPEVVVAPGDVSQNEDVERVFTDTVQTFGRIDAVVHAAGVAAYGRFVDVPGEVFERVQQINVVGSGNVARASLQQFDRQGQGHLILFGSLVGKVATPFMTPYVVSKWAVRGLARTLQAETQNNDIHVGLVEPAGVDTSIYAKAASYLGVQGRPPPPVLGPEKVADAVVDMLGRPRRTRSVGILNPLLTSSFRFLPPVYDRLAVPLMKIMGLDSAPVPAHSGNLFHPLPEPNPMEDPMTAVVTRHIDAPPADVWTVLANGWLYPSWVVGASRMRDVDRAWPATGSRLHHSVGNWPILINDKTEVLDCKPQQLLRLKAHAWPAGTADVLMELEPDGSGTLVRMQEDAASGPAVAMPKPLRQALIVPRNREALRRLAFLAEGGAAQE